MRFILCAAISFAIAGCPFVDVDLTSTNNNIHTADPTPTPSPTPLPCFPAGASCSTNAECCGAQTGQTGACVVDATTGAGACR